MKYQIQINNAAEATGTIDLERLLLIAKGVRRISEGALNIYLRGKSDRRGSNNDLKEALKVTLTGLKGGSTVIGLEAEKFEKTLKNYQTNIFRQEAQQKLPQHTPVSLFIQTFRNAMDDKNDFELLDKQLLKNLKEFSKALLNEKEEIIVTNQDSIRELKLAHRDFKKIKNLEKETPSSRPHILNGIVEELKYSKLKVKIQTDEGILDGFLSEKMHPQDIAPYWGKKVTIVGTAHFKPSGKPFIEIEKLFEAGKGDEYFSKKPKSETAEQQLERQIREKGGNRLSEIVGKWPGDETDEEFEQMLKDLD